MPVTVIGVLGRKGQNAWGHDQDVNVMVPLSTARRKLFGRIPVLVEAVILALVGGVLGIVVGLGGARAISYFAAWRILIELEPVLGAFGFAAAIGIVFGLYPARKAARLDPIEALRHE